MISAVGFVLQGVALWCAFQAATPSQAGVFFVLSAIAAGSHSVGFRPVYLEASPEHAGAISGFGNTIASCASVLGPVIIGSSIYNQKNGEQFNNSSRRELVFQDRGEENSKMTMRTEDWSMVAFYMILANLCGALAALCISYSSHQRRRQKHRKKYSV